MSSPPRATPITRTPNRRAITAEPPSTARRAPVHTPLDRSVTRDLLRSVRRGTPASAGARRNNAPTPHAKAARRALDQRRAAMFTPGKNRRRSQMEQRQTPMGLLRDLGKALAPKSKPLASSSSSASSPPTRRSVSARPSILPFEEDDEPEENIEEEEGDPNDDSSSEGPQLKRPRFSLPIDEDDDDDDDLQPPRLSGVEELDFTVGSIELPRRDVGQMRSPYSRGSIGSLRPSDVFDQDVLSDDGQRPSDFFPGFLEGLQQRPAMDDATLERLDIDPIRQPTLPRESDFNLEGPAAVEDQTTFLLSEPNIDVAPTSPIEERSIVEGAADEAVGATDAGPSADLTLDPPVFDADDDDDNGPPAFNDLPEYDDRSDFDEGPAFNDLSGYDDRSDLDNLGPGEDIVVDVTEPRLRPFQDSAAMKSAQAKAKNALHLRNRVKRISQHGIEYPALPSSFVKKVAQTALQSSGLSNNRVSADTLLALTQASEWYFEQLGDDLGAYASHAKRKTIEESDVATLMRRQRQIGSNSTMFSLAQKHLPRELLQELRIPLPQPAKQRRAKRPRPGDDEEEVEAA